MENYGLSEAFCQLLEFQEPWFIESVAINSKTKVVDVHINYRHGSTFTCSECDRSCKVHDSSFKRIRHLDLFEYRCYLNVKVPRTKCRQHGVKTLVKLPSIRPGSHFSLLFEQKLMRMASEMSMIAIARELGESDATLWRIFRHYVKNATKYQLDLKKVRRVNVDETAIKRGHNYMTIFTDHDTAQVIYVAEGRKMEVFEEFKTWLVQKGGKIEQIELFSMDMSASFKAGQMEYFPQSNTVTDHFHIKQALNKAVDTTRKADVQHHENLKKTKYLWLKNVKNLTESEKMKLHNLLIDSSIQTVWAYKLKLEFAEIFQMPKNIAVSSLEIWMDRARDFNIPAINTFLVTLRNNWKGVTQALTSFVSNGLAEGINSKIQIAKARARGYPNFENFKQMVYFLGNDFKFGFHS